MSIPSRIDRETLAQLTFGCAAGVALGAVIATETWIVGVVALVLAVVVLAALFLDAAMLILCLSALIQIPLMSLGPISSPVLLDLAVPVVAAGLALRATTAPAALPRPSTQRPMPVKILNVSLLLFAGALALGLLRSATSPDVDADAGLVRVFYGYAIALTTYALLYYALIRRIVTMRRLLDLLFNVSLAISVIGLVAVFLDIPLSLGNVRYSVVDYASGAVRIGFLEIFGIIGIGLVLARPVRWRMGATAIFAAALLASGGRAVVLGVLVAVVAYLLLTGKGHRLIAISLVGAVVVWSLPTVSSLPQVERVSDVSPGALENAGRLYIYDRSFEAFAERPLLGTGIGAPVTVHEPNRELASFYEEQLEVGGHATYAALLKNFGLLGLVPFAAALLAALIGLARRAGANSYAGFFFLFLVAEAIRLAVSGNGSDPVLYVALAGGAAAISLPGSD